MLEVAGIDAFYGRAHILHGLSLAIGPGEVVALLGRNGAGKTTTLKAIMQMVRTRSGTIRFEGRDITRWPTYRICRRGIGFVPEDRRIFTNLSVEKNLEVGRLPARDGLPGWSEDRLFELFPNLRERRGNMGHQISGGEQQMLTIARTLMGNPKLLLLDEPSEGIAPVIVEQMARTILELKSRGLSILLSEQNLNFARAVADRVYIVEGGSVKFDGTLAELEQQPDIRDAYLSV